MSFSEYHLNHKMWTFKETRYKLLAIMVENEK